MSKRSLTTSMAWALLAIVLLAMVSGGLALITLSASLKDAEAINIAGSLRMQSYRMVWDARYDPAEMDNDIKHYQLTLDAPPLRNLDRYYVPDAVRGRYHSLIATWLRLKPELQAGQTASYQQNLAQHVEEIDHFVLALQRWAEQKMMLVVGTGVSGFIMIMLLAFWILRFVRHQIVGPLEKLLTASQQIEQAQFQHLPLDTLLQNELGVLARAFTQMSTEVARHYHDLEDRVREKTCDLRQANRRLSLLYRCAKTLSSQPDPTRSIPLVMDKILQHNSIAALHLDVPPGWDIAAGSEDSTLSWQTLPVKVTPAITGKFCWQSSNSEPHLMQGLVSMLERSLLLEQTQKKVQHLLVMEERTIIARELHDSLAQSLTYLRIQVLRLKRLMPDTQHQCLDVVSDIEQALSGAYRQLRELLTTFRLSIAPADLPTALEQVITPLRHQSQAVISLTGVADCQRLEGQRLVHILQIVREALLNAISHADATEISVDCHTHAGEENVIEIRDNGSGMHHQQSPPGHYGLSILQERASSLGGSLAISSSPGEGTCVRLVFPPSPKQQPVHNPQQTRPAVFF
ncbi:MAG: Nitrate/nitrite sensor protein NarQ [Candidatus Erwinia impunctatus]|nr:Nitrate/nitrite sensor protein NarQ [Culicoides impunctatus]